MNAADRAAERAERIEAERRAGGKPTKAERAAYRLINASRRALDAQERYLHWTHELSPRAAAAAAKWEAAAAWLDRRETELLDVLAEPDGGAR